LLARYLYFAAPALPADEFFACEPDAVEEVAMRQRLSDLALAACLAFAVADASAHDEGDARARGAQSPFGHAHFQTSCSAEAQRQFDRALTMLHSFFFPETINAFAAIPATDPQCAIAYWGLAISQRPNPLVGPFDAATLKRGLDAVEKGEAIGAKTQRERDWLAAIKEFYKDYPSVDQDTRARNYEKAMEALMQKYPSDVEARIFYALALNETYDHHDKSYAALLKAAHLLEPLDRRYPDHPGITHYIIHSYDFAPIARRGLKAADKYSALAPSAPHALHMPSHIYSQLGLWEKSVAANQRTLARSRAYMDEVKLDGLYGGIAHSWDFMEYAYLQMGRDDLAKGLVDDVQAVTKLFRPGLAAEAGMAAVPARYMLERQDWKGAAALEPMAVLKSPVAEAITRYARAVGAARSGSPDAAQGDIDRLAALRTALEQANQGYWAQQVEIQQLSAQGWQAQARGNSSQALKLARAAADLEDSSVKHVAMEHRLYPMREQLADLLLAQGQPLAALKEYEASMIDAPNRLRGWYGAATAAQAAGDKAKATSYFTKLSRLVHGATSDRPEVHDARVQVAGR
jgi:tetratricopeptide (TPR) repeat protein